MDKKRQNRKKSWTNQEIEQRLSDLGLTSREGGNHRHWYKGDKWVTQTTRHSGEVSQTVISKIRRALRMIGLMLALPLVIGIGVLIAQQFIH